MSGFTVADIPKGDQYRTGTETTVTTSDTTILTLTNTSGILHGVFLDVGFSSPGLVTVDTVKVTVDGAAERTLNGTIFKGSAEVNTSRYCPLPIRFASSLTLKLHKTDGGAVGTVKATAHYSVY